DSLAYQQFQFVTNDAPIDVQVDPDDWILKHIDRVTGIADGENEQPQRFELAQNYPNPFNPTTTIPFQLSQSANVTLRIVDLTGRTVAELLNGRKPAGSHEIEFFAGNIGSGIYFYVLTVDGVRESRRMILLK
ncbi:MAG: T9SS type A sorting domain-containing protein, partial [Calditrichia bacterium]